MEPTFVIAGGQRCGTTALYHLLNAHPQVYLAGPVRPEPKYFLQPPTPERDKAWYLNQWFSDTGAALAVGEKSTSYLESPAAAQRMKTMFPRLRAIFVLRHPVERAWSNYWFSRAAGLETLSFDEAVAREDERMSQQAFPQMSTHPFAYVRRGRYAEMLAAYDRYFAQDEMCIVLHDDLLHDPGGVARRLFEFLGVDPTAVRELPAMRYNITSPTEDEHIGPATMDYLFDQFRAGNRLLAERLERDLSAWDVPTPTLLRWAKPRG